ncbi:unnamed protein product [Gordionus sp. m RMFG-2023]
MPQLMFHNCNNENHIFLKYLILIFLSSFNKSYANFTRFTFSRTYYSGYIYEGSEGQDLVLPVISPINSDSGYNDSLAWAELFMGIPIPCNAEIYGNATGINKVVKEGIRYVITGYEFKIIEGDPENMFQVETAVDGSLIRVVVRVRKNRAEEVNRERKARYSVEISSVVKYHIVSKEPNGTNREHVKYDRPRHETYPARGDLKASFPYSLSNKSLDSLNPDLYDLPDDIFLKNSQIYYAKFFEKPYPFQSKKNDKNNDRRIKPTRKHIRRQKKRLKMAARHGSSKFRKNLKYSKRYSKERISRDRCTLAISVRDSNELTPLFNHKSYYLTLKDDSNYSLYAPLLKIIASDADAGENARVSYSFLRFQPGFDMDSNTGEVFLTQRTDQLKGFEDGWLNLTIVAEDHGPMSNRKSNSITLHVFYNKTDITKSFDPLMDVLEYSAGELSKSDHYHLSVDHLNADSFFLDRVLAVIRIRPNPAQTSACDIISVSLNLTHNGSAFFELKEIPNSDFDNEYSDESIESKNRSYQLILNYKRLALLVTSSRVSRPSNEFVPFENNFHVRLKIVTSQGEESYSSHDATLTLTQYQAFLKKSLTLSFEALTPIELNEFTPFNTPIVELHTTKQARSLKKCGFFKYRLITGNTDGLFEIDHDVGIIRLKGPTFRSRSRDVVFPLFRTGYSTVLGKSNQFYDLNVEVAFVKHVVSNVECRLLHRFYEFYFLNGLTKLVNSNSVNMIPVRIVVPQLEIDIFIYANEPYQRITFKVFDANVDNVSTSFMEINNLTLSQGINSIDDSSNGRYLFDSFLIATKSSVKINDSFTNNDNNRSLGQGDSIFFVDSFTGQVRVNVTNLRILGRSEFSTFCNISFLLLVQVIDRATVSKHKLSSISYKLLDIKVIYERPCLEFNNRENNKFPLRPHSKDLISRNIDVHLGDSIKRRGVIIDMYAIVLPYLGWSLVYSKRNMPGTRNFTHNGPINDLYHKTLLQRLSRYLFFMSDPNDYNCFDLDIEEGSLYSKDGVNTSQCFGDRNSSVVVIFERLINVLVVSFYDRKVIHKLRLLLYFHPLEQVQKFMTPKYGGPELPELVHYYNLNETGPELSHLNYLTDLLYDFQTILSNTASPLPLLVNVTDRSIGSTVFSFPRSMLDFRCTQNETWKLVQASQIISESLGGFASVMFVSRPVPEFLGLDPFDSTRIYISSNPQDQIGKSVSFTIAISVYKTNRHDINPKFCRLITFEVNITLLFEDIYYSLNFNGPIFIDRGLPVSVFRFALQMNDVMKATGDTSQNRLSLGMVKVNNGRMINSPLGRFRFLKLSIDNKYLDIDPISGLVFMAMSHLRDRLFISSVQVVSAQEISRLVGLYENVLADVLNSLSLTIALVREGGINSSTPVILAKARVLVQLVNINAFLFNISNSLSFDSSIWNKTATTFSIRYDDPIHTLVGSLIPLQIFPSIKLALRFRSHLTPPDPFFLDSNDKCKIRYRVMDPPLSFAFNQSSSTSSYYLNVRHLRHKSTDSFSEHSFFRIDPFTGEIMLIKDPMKPQLPPKVEWHITVRQELVCGYTYAPNLKMLRHDQNVFVDEALIAFRYRRVAIKIEESTGSNNFFPHFKRVIEAPGSMKDAKTLNSQELLSYNSKKILKLRIFFDKLDDTIIKVSAQDLDLSASGPDQNIRYSIVYDYFAQAEDGHNILPHPYRFSKPWKLVVINESTGEIKVRKMSSSKQLISLLTSPETCNLKQRGRYHLPIITSLGLIARARDNIKGEKYPKANLIRDTYLPITLKFSAKRKSPDFEDTIVAKETHYVARIHENSPPDTFVTIITVVPVLYYLYEGEEGIESSFNQSSPSNNHKFSLWGSDSKYFAILQNGIIVISEFVNENPLDRETKSLYSFTVFIKNLNDLSINSKTRVYVTLIDENDNVPQMTQKIYTIKTPIIEAKFYKRFPIFQALALDPDTDENARIQYGFYKGTGPLIHNGDVGSVKEHESSQIVTIDGTSFLLDITTGRVYITDPLPTEPRKFLLDIKAFNPVAPSLYTHSRYIVRTVLMDPSMISATEPRLLPYYNISLSKSTKVGDTIQIPLAISGLFLDSGPKVYWAWFGNANSGNIEQPDKIPSNTGFYFNNQVDAIVLTQSHLKNDRLACESRPFLFYITDGFKIYQSEFRVSVDCINDTFPIFENHFYRIEIGEDVPINSSILRLLTKDSDPNNGLTYSIYNYLNVESKSRFTVHSNSGVIYVSRNLNAILAPIHLLVVRVMDQSTNIPDFARVLITVKPGQKCCPVMLTQDVLVVNFTADSPVGTKLIRLALSSNTSTIGAVRFAIESGNYHGLFALHPWTGQLYLAQSLLYSETLVNLNNSRHLFRVNYFARYQLIVSASPRFQETTDSDFALVFLNILPDGQASNVEMKAIGSSYTYKVKVLESTPKDTLILSLSDKPELNGGNMYTYRIMEGNQALHFYINFRTGAIYIDSPFIDSKSSLPKELPFCKSVRNDELSTLLNPYLYIRHFTIIIIATAYFYDYNIPLGAQTVQITVKIETIPDLSMLKALKIRFRTGRLNRLLRIPSLTAEWYGDRQLRLFDPFSSSRVQTVSEYLARTVGRGCIISGNVVNDNYHKPIHKKEKDNDNHYKSLVTPFLSYRIHPVDLYGPAQIFSVDSLTGLVKMFEQLHGGYIVPEYLSSIQFRVLVKFEPPKPEHLAHLVKSFVIGIVGINVSMKHQMRVIDHPKSRDDFINNVETTSRVSIYGPVYPGTKVYDIGKLLSEKGFDYMAQVKIIDSYNQGEDMFEIDQTRGIIYSKNLIFLSGIYNLKLAIYLYNRIETYDLKIVILSLKDDALLDFEFPNYSLKFSENTDLTQQPLLRLKTFSTLDNLPIFRTLPLSYSLVNDKENIFTIDPLFGVLSLNSSALTGFDAEIHSSFTLIISVALKFPSSLITLANLTKNLYRRQTKVTISVSDLNDNTPVFEPRFMQLITDLNYGEFLRSEISSYAPVIVDLRLKKSLLYFDKKEIKFLKIQATDNDVSAPNNIVEYRIINQGYNVPSYCKNSKTEIEADPIGYVNGSDTCMQINFDGNSSGIYYSVDPKSGEISFVVHNVTAVHSNLEYHLYVQAQDGGDPSLSCFLNLTLHLQLSTSDTDPISDSFFTPYQHLIESGNSSKSCESFSFDGGWILAKLPENSPTGTIVFRLLASIFENVPYLSASIYYDNIKNTVYDDNIEIEDQIQVINNGFSFVSADLGDEFDLSFYTGRLTLVKPLNYETTNYYNFTVSVTHIKSSAWWNLNASVSVEDVNDNVPSFTKALYIFHIFETNELGQIICNVTASDSDSNYNSFLEYRIEPWETNIENLGIEMFPFFIEDNKSGLVYNNDTLDYELHRVYVFKLVAEDLGIPRLSSFTLIEVRVLDVNDNPPQFPAKNYEIYIENKFKPRQVIFQFVAQDEDIVSRDKLAYGILSGNDCAIFDLDPITGFLNVAIVPEYPFLDSFTLNVTVFDGLFYDFAVLTLRYNQLTKDRPFTLREFYSFIDLEVLKRGDENLDPNDTFMESLGTLTFEQTLYINGNIVSPTLLGKVSIPSHLTPLLAYSTNPSIQYKLISSYRDINFSLVPSPTNGDYSAFLYLTHGSFNVSFFLSLVVLVNMTPSPVNLFGTLRLIILNRTEKPERPNFIVKYYNVDVSNLIVGGTELLRLEPLPQLNPSRLEYLVLANTSNQTHSPSSFHLEKWVDIDKTSGIVRLKRSLKEYFHQGGTKERSFDISFTARIRDKRNVLDFNDVPITVSVKDINDEADFGCSKPFYHFMIPEDSTHGSIIGHISSIASGEPSVSSVGANYSYFLVPGFVESNNAFYTFIIDNVNGSSQGNLKLNPSGPGLDRSKIQEYLFKVGVIRHYDKISLKRYCNAMVTVKSSTVPKLVFECETINNSDAIYNFTRYPIFKRLVPGYEDSSNLTESLNTCQEIDVYEDAYDLKDRVNGSSCPIRPPPLFKIRAHFADLLNSESANLTYSIESVHTIPAKKMGKINVFTHDTEIRLEKADSFAQGLIIDHTLGLIYFDPSLVNEWGNGNDYTLDRERVRAYIINVTVIYFGDDFENKDKIFSNHKYSHHDVEHFKGRKIWAHFLVNVVDINDNSPHFLDSSGQIVKEYRFSSMEGHIQSNKSIAQITAIDPDVADKLTFYLRGKHSNHFLIRNDGSLYVASHGLDREKVSSYNLSLSVTDGLHIAHANLLITVLDVNDNAPVCQDELVLWIPEDIPSQSYVGMIHASDVDSTSIGKLTYQIVHSDRNFHIVNIDHNQGLIMIISPGLDRETIPHYSYTVKVMDQGSLFCLTKLVINLLDVNDNPPLFMLSSKHRRFFTFPLNIFELHSNQSYWMITKVTAMDHDTGKNAQIKYTLSILSPQRGSLPHLTIDHSSGIIGINNSASSFLSRLGNLTETDKIIRFQVRATDSGNPSLSTYLNMTLSLIDTPIRHISNYYLKYYLGVPSDLALGSALIHVDDLFPNAESVNDSSSEYEITNGNGEGYFTLGKDGYITLNESLTNVFQKAKAPFDRTSLNFSVDLFKRNKALNEITECAHLIIEVKMVKIYGSSAADLTTLTVPTSLIPMSTTTDNTITPDLLSTTNYYPSSSTITKENRSICENIDAENSTNSKNAQYYSYTLPLQYRQVPPGKLLTAFYGSHITLVCCPIGFLCRSEQLFQFDSISKTLISGTFLAPGTYHLFVESSTTENGKNLESPMVKVIRLDVLGISDISIHTSEEISRNSIVMELRPINVINFYLLNMWETFIDKMAYIFDTEKKNIHLLSIVPLTNSKIDNVISKMGKFFKRGHHSDNEDSIQIIFAISTTDLANGSFSLVPPELIISRLESSNGSKKLASVLGLHLVRPLKNSACLNRSILCPNQTQCVSIVNIGFSNKPDDMYPIVLLTHNCILNLQTNTVKPVNVSMDELTRVLESATTISPQAACCSADHGDNFNTSLSLLMGSAIENGRLLNINTIAKNYNAFTKASFNVDTHVEKVNPQKKSQLNLSKKFNDYSYKAKTKNLNYKIYEQGPPGTCHLAQITRERNLHGFINRTFDTIVLALIKNDPLRQLIDEDHENVVSIDGSSYSDESYAHFYLKRWPANSNPVETGFDKSHKTIKARTMPLNISFDLAIPSIPEVRIGYVTVITIRFRVINKAEQHISSLRGPHQIYSLSLQKHHGRSGSLRLITTSRIDRDIKQYHYPQVTRSGNVSLLLFHAREGQRSHISEKSGDSLDVLERENDENGEEKEEIETQMQKAVLGLGKLDPIGKANDWSLAHIRIYSNDMRKGRVEVQLSVLSGSSKSLYLKKGRIIPVIAEVGEWELILGTRWDGVQSDNKTGFVGCLANLQINGFSPITNILNHDSLFYDITTKSTIGSRLYNDSTLISLDNNNFLIKRTRLINVDYECPAKMNRNHPLNPKFLINDTIEGQCLNRIDESRPEISQFLGVKNFGIKWACESQLTSTRINLSIKGCGEVCPNGKGTIYFKSPQIEEESPYSTSYCIYQLTFNDSQIIDVKTHGNSSSTLIHSIKGWFASLDPVDYLKFFFTLPAIVFMSLTMLMVCGHYFCRYKRRRKNGHLKKLTSFYFPTSANDVNENYNNNGIKGHIDPNNNYNRSLNVTNDSPSGTERSTLIKSKVGKYGKDSKNCDKGGSRYAMLSTRKTLQITDDIARDPQLCVLMSKSLKFKEKNERKLKKRSNFFKFFGKSDHSQSHQNIDESLSYNPSTPMVRLNNNVIIHRNNLAVSRSILTESRSDNIDKGSFQKCLPRAKDKAVYSSYDDNEDDASSMDRTCTLNSSMTTISHQKSKVTTVTGHTAKSQQFTLNLNVNTFLSDPLSAGNDNKNGGKLTNAKSQQTGVCDEKLLRDITKDEMKRISKLSNFDLDTSPNTKEWNMNNIVAIQNDKTNNLTIKNDLNLKSSHYNKLAYDYYPPCNLNMQDKLNFQCMNDEIQLLLMNGKEVRDENIFKPSPLTKHYKLSFKEPKTNNFDRKANQRLNTLLTSNNKFDRIYTKNKNRPLSFNQAISFNSRSELKNLVPRHFKSNHTLAAQNNTETSIINSISTDESFDNYKGAFDIKKLFALLNPESQISTTLAESQRLDNILNNAIDDYFYTPSNDENLDTENTGLLNP